MTYIPPSRYLTLTQKTPAVYLCVLHKYLLISEMYLIYIGHLAGLTVSKRPGNSHQIEIHFAVFNHLYLLFSFVKLVETS